MSVRGYCDLDWNEYDENWDVPPAKRVKQDQSFSPYSFFPQSCYDWNGNSSDLMLLDPDINLKQIHPDGNLLPSEENSFLSEASSHDAGSLLQLCATAPCVEQYIQSHSPELNPLDDQWGCFGDPYDSADPQSVGHQEHTSGEGGPPGFGQPQDIHESRTQAEICYGTITDAAVSDARYFKKLFDGQSTSSFAEASLSYLGGLLTVHNRSGAYCGLLCSRVARALAIITQKFPLQFEVHAIVEDRERNRAAISINVYGSRRDSDGVAELLSDSEIFLQRPFKYDSNYEYCNPQYFNIPETERADVDMTTDLSHDNATMSRHLRPHGVQDMLETLLPRQDTSPISEKWLGDGLVSGRLQTPLLEHQRQALCFMREIEGGSLAIGRKYQAQCCLGGILADQMGLGKTLTALALAAASIPGEDAQFSPRWVGTTLFVVPASTLPTWQEQIYLHTAPGRLRVCFYHGSRRRSAFRETEQPHIVLTTYSTLVSEHQSKNSLLHEKEWLRVFLDEAHFIKDRKTKRFQAVCSLKAEHRWCLTGTPIQNCIDDLCALLIFIRRAPFDSHREFQSQIITPLKNGDCNGLERLRSLLRSVTLRRTKDILSLPPREDLDIELVLSRNERELYEIARDETEFILEDCLGSNDFSKGFSIIQSILRQRQICNHGVDLLPQGVRSRLLKRHRLESWRKESPTSDGYPAFCEACGLEMEEDECEMRFEFCFHLVCTKCLPARSTEIDPASMCPICNEMVGGVKKQNPNLSLEAWIHELDYLGPSTKVRALLENIKELNRDESFAKSVVFSSWVRMLYLIERALKNENINCVRLDGTIAVKDKGVILETFQNKPETKVLLISIGAGSVGLNLTAASHVHLMEPQWNPMVENQAFDRIHRIGQSKPVKTFRYIAKTTFDEAIVELQRKKLDLAELSLGSTEHTRTDQIRKKLESLRAVFR